MRKQEMKVKETPVATAERLRSRLLRTVTVGLLAAGATLLIANSATAAQDPDIDEQDPVVAAQAPAPAEQDSGAARSATSLQAVATSPPIVLVRGTSEIIDHRGTLQRVSIADPNIADAVVVSANEIVVNAKALGQTTLLLWDQGGGRAMYQVHVTADAAAIQKQIDRLMPAMGILATASGHSIILSGSVHDPGVEERAVALATLLAGDAQVLNQIAVADRGQILLKVRFAEVNRTALDEFGLEALAFNDDNIAAGVGSGQFFRPPDDNSDALVETSQEAVNFFLFERTSQVVGFMRALQTRGLLKSLAEPNLMAVPGGTASFLAGGEFPFPVLQGGGVGNAVTIQFKEFGIRLNFVPTITNSGSVRIHVAPEVSQLDFSQGLEVSGFRIPALLTRRAETVIELSDGQTFAIAGLVDNTMTKLVNKIPLLGDIPILGALFRSEEMRQNRSELLVLVTVHIIRPADGPPPPVPTGEPETWEGKLEAEQPERQGQTRPDGSDTGGDVETGGGGETGGDGDAEATGSGRPAAVPNGTGETHSRGRSR